MFTIDITGDILLYLFNRILHDKARMSFGLKVMIIFEVNVKFAEFPCLFDYKAGADAI